MLQAFWRVSRGPWWPSIFLASSHALAEPAGGRAPLPRGVLPAALAHSLAMVQTHRMQWTPKGGCGMSRLGKLAAWGLVACVAVLASVAVTAQAQERGVE